MWKCDCQYLKTKNCVIIQEGPSSFRVGCKGVGVGMGVGDGWVGGIILCPHMLKKVRFCVFDPIFGLLLHPFGPLLATINPIPVEI